MVEGPKLKSRGREPDSVDNLEVSDRVFAKAVRKLANTPPQPREEAAAKEPGKAKRKRL